MTRFHFDLNKYQRAALVGAAALIVIVQFAQFTNNHRIQGYGWIFAFLVAGFLLVIAFSKTQDSATTSHSVKGIEVLANQKHAADLVTETLALGEKLQSQMEDWVPNISTITSMVFSESAGLTALRRKMWHQYSIAYSFALVACVEYKKDRKFFDGDVYTLFLANTANKMASLFEPMHREVSEKPYDRTQARLSAGKDLLEARRALQAFFEALASGDKNPDTPLVQYLVDKIGISGVLLPSFVQHLQEFTQNALNKLVAKRPKE